ncbi:MAG: holo-ACP synthase [Deltaproteobacteria bacterium]|nr:holo-ACP synthase [Deltaproteobacteria bacterium]
MDIEMIYGIGVDLVHVPRMEKVIKRWGNRFVDRVFTPLERDTAYKRTYPYSAFALRFAAKEALSKAVGLGMREGVKWKEIEIIHDPRGKPQIRLKGKTECICREKGITGVHVTLSDEGDNAIAVVVLEKSDETSQGF